MRVASVCEVSSQHSAVDCCRKPSVAVIVGDVQCESDQQEVVCFERLFHWCPCFEVAFSCSCNVVLITASSVYSSVCVFLCFLQSCKISCVVNKDRFNLLV